MLETFGKNEIEKSSDSEPILALPSGTDDGSSNIDNIEKNAASNELTVEADKTVTQIDEVEDGQIVPYWVPTLDIVIVQDMPDAFGRNAIPSAILQHLSFNEIGNYYPVIYHNGSLPIVSVM